MPTKTYARPGRKDRKHNRLSLLAQMYFDIEKLRVSQQVRQTHLKEDGSPFAEDPIFERVLTHLLNAQGELDEDMKPLVPGHPCWTDFALHVKGVGPHLLALVMGLIRDITPFTNVSKLWYLCGFAVADGKAMRPVNGQVLNYDARLKSLLLGRVGGQMLRNGDPFARSLYDAFRAKEEEKQSKFVHRRALRKVVKLWVACLWDVWRRAEGLPVTPHYAEAHLGHTGDAVTSERWVEFNQRAAKDGKA